MNEKTILAFDCGSRTGWAVMEPIIVGGGYRAISGIQDFSLSRGESAGMRFIRFNAWLREMLDKVRPGVVAYEQAHLRGGYATDLLVGFTSRIQEECARRGIEFTAVHSATIKKEATGKGTAKKEQMIAAAAERYGKDPRTLDDNEADALCLLTYMGRIV